MIRETQDMEKEKVLDEYPTEEQGRSSASKKDYVNIFVDKDKSKFDKRIFKKNSSADREPVKEDSEVKKPSTAQIEALLAAAKSKEDAAVAEAEQTHQTLLRTAAEYDNFRKRSQREYETAYTNGVASAVQELFSLLDTVEAAANAPSADEDYKKGVLMIQKQALDAFERLGVCEIEAQGMPFDPELHNAIMQEAVEDAEPGTITKVMQKGYQMADKVIRHSMVAVAP